VVHDDTAAELALAEEVLKLEAGTEGDVLAEHLPSMVAVAEGSFDCL